MAGTGTWLCACGRRVPARFDTCHCGMSRAIAAAMPAPVEAVPASDPGRWSGRWRAWRRFLPAVALVALYGGNRACVQSNASEAALEIGMKRLGAMMEPSQTRPYAVRHHEACFREHYRLGWGGPSASTFDAPAYAECLVDRVRIEAGTSSASGPAWQGASPARRRRARERTPLPLETSPPAPTEEAPLPLLLLGEVKVSRFRRNPHLAAQVTFMAIGAARALQADHVCVYAVRCGSELDTGQRMVSCLALGDMRATGSLDIALTEAVPPESSCTLDVWLANAQGPRSNTVSVPLS